MSGPRARSEFVDKCVKKEKAQHSSDESEDDDENEGHGKKWSALRDDFMTGKKVGWDKSDDEEDDEDEEESMSDSD